MASWGTAEKRPNAVKSASIAVAIRSPASRQLGWRPAVKNIALSEFLGPPLCLISAMSSINSTEALEQIAWKNSDRVVLAKSNGTLAPEDLANELHPKPSGFKKIAVERWKPALQQFGLAAA
jgi:hypothetical protein